MSSSEPPHLDVTWPKEVEPRAEVTSAIRRACTQNLVPARGLSAPARFWLSVLLSGSVVGLLMLGRWTRLSGDTVGKTLVTAAVWGLIHAAVLFLGLARPPGHRGSRSLRWALALGVPLLFFGYLTLVAQHFAPIGAYLTDSAVHETGMCAVLVLLLGALATGGVMVFWRGTDPLTPGLSGALAGLSGGLVGAVAMGISCPCGQLWHLWLAHGSGVVTLTVAGWFAGKRWLAP